MLDVALVGGKGVNFGEFLWVDGVIVLLGFCVTVYVFWWVIVFVLLIDCLLCLDLVDWCGICVLSEEFCWVVEGIVIFDDVVLVIIVCFDE